MLKELSTTIATDFTPFTSTAEKEKTAGFENTRTSSTRVKALMRSNIKSFILDLLAVSPCEAKRNCTEGKLFLIPPFLEIRCAIIGRATVTIPIKKKGFKKEKFNSCLYLSAI